MTGIIGSPKASGPPSANGASPLPNKASVDAETAAKKAAATADDLKDIAWRFLLAQQVAQDRAAAAGGVGDTGERAVGKGSDKNFNRIQKVINRVKHLTEKDKASLIEEIRSLRLDLFLSELANGLTEADIKPSAIRAATEVAVTLATAYPDFSALFVSSLNKNIAALASSFAAAADGVPEGSASFADSSALTPTDAAAKQQQLASRLRLLLRFLTDLLLLDVLPVSLEPLLLQLVVLAAAAPPKAAVREQQEDEGQSAGAASLDRNDASSWPALSALSLNQRGGSSSGVSSPTLSSSAEAAASTAAAAASTAPAAASTTAAAASTTAAAAAAEAADFAAPAAAAAAAMPQGKWLYSMSLCLFRLQALGGIFSRKAAQLVLTQEQQRERLATTVSLLIKRDSSEHPVNGAKQKEPGGAVSSSDSEAAHHSPARAGGSGSPPRAADAKGAGNTAETDILRFESLTPALVHQVFKKEGLSLPEAEAALAALALPKDVPSAPYRAKIISLLHAFYVRGVLPMLLALQRELLQQEVHNMQQTVDRGSVAADCLSRFTTLSDKHKAAFLHAAAIAELLRVPPPDAAEIERAAAATIHGGYLVLGVTRLNTGGPGGPSASPSTANGEEDPAWRNKEERLFYTEIIDLYEALPPGLLGNREPKEDRGRAAGEQITAGAVTPPNKAGALKAPAATTSEETSALTASAAPPTAPASGSSSTADGGAGMTAFLSRLPQATTPHQIDQLAVDFFLGRLHTKPNRTALAKALLHVPRTQLHLLPPYARLLAILRKPLKEETSHVLESLQADLKKFVEEHDPEKIESKIKCIRYISECTKFRLLPPGLLLNAFSALLEDLTPHRIQMIAHLAAGCGHFLLHSRLTEERFRGLITRMLRLSAARHLPPEQECRIQEIYYDLCGAEGDAIGITDTKDPLQRFIEKLIYKDLYGSEEEAEEVAKLCRKLPWSSNPNILKWFRGCLLELGDHTNFEYVYRHAALLSALAKYIPAAVISCVDCLLEDIQFGMERENPEDAPKRVLQARLLGELYNYRLVDSSVLFDALYALIGFGGPTAFQAGNIRTTHRLLFEGARTLQQQQQQQPQQQQEGGWATAAVYEQLPLPLLPPASSPSDPPQSVTRIKMILQLLQSSGRYFSSGKASLKFDRFLLFFERYCRHKAETARAHLGEVDEVLRRLRPHRKQIKTAIEADAAAAKLLQEEAAILQNLGEGPVEEFRDEKALYGDSDGSDTEDTAAAETPQNTKTEAEVEETPGERKEVVTETEGEESTDDDFDAEFAAAMEEAAKEARVTKQNQQQPFRLPWATAIKDVPPAGGDVRNAPTAISMASVSTPGGGTAATEGDSEIDKETETSGLHPGRSPHSDDIEEEDEQPKPTVTLTLLQRRSEKRGKMQLRPLTVPADISLIQPLQQQQEKQQKQQQERANIERFVVESVLGAAATRNPPAPKNAKAAIRAANAKVPGLAVSVAPSGNTGGVTVSSNADSRDAGKHSRASAAPAEAASAGGSRRHKGIRGKSEPSH